jgi:hypothetical protein
MEGLRVHPKYRGKGYANAITKYLVDEAKHLGIARLRYTTGSRNKASLKLAKMAGFSILFKMTVAWIIKPKKISQIHGYPTIRETTPATTYRMLRSEPSMIPQRILVFDWKALDFNLENLKQIGKTHHFLAALRNESIDSLSFGFPRQEPSQTRWSFTVYSKDRQGFEAQLFHNLATAMNHDFTSIMTTFENRFEKPFKKLDFQAEEKGIMHIVLVEKQIRFRKRKSTDGRS